MAGPVLREGHGVGDAPGLLPKYFDSKLFTYDWMRSKIWLVSLDAQENYAGMEVWRSGLKHPMDFELAQDQFGQQRVGLPQYLEQIALQELS